MNQEEDGPGSQDASPEGETATGRVRRILIQPLAGLARPKGVLAGQHAENMERLARKLAYMTGDGLSGLRDLCLGQAGLLAVPKRAVPVCPVDGVILSWAYALEAPPIGQSDYAASVMRSSMGRRAHDLGFGVELLRMARRLGPPPGRYLVVQLQDEAKENRLRRKGLRRAIEAGEYVPQNRRDWLDAWYADALVVERLIAEGDERRLIRARAAEGEGEAA